MPRILFTRAAQADLADAIAWYEARAPEVVAQFRQTVSSIVSHIEENPKQYPPSSWGTRRALMRRFPYLLVFRETDAAIYIVAVFHTSRDPRTWRNRMS